MRAQPKQEMIIRSYNRRTPAGNKAKTDLKLKVTDDFTVMKRFYSTSPGRHGTLTLELLDWHNAGYVFYAPEEDFTLFGKERPITNA